MFFWSFVFLIIGLVAGALGLTGVAGTATEFAWITFWLGLIMGVLFFFVARHSPSDEP